MAGEKHARVAHSLTSSVGVETGHDEARARGKFADMCPRMGGGLHFTCRKTSLAESVWRVEVVSGSKAHRLAVKMAAAARPGGHKLAKRA